MGILGSIGKLYTFVLLVILFLGSGLAVWAGISAVMNKKDSMNEKMDKIKENLRSKLQTIVNKINQQAVSLDKNKNIIGGFNMKNNGFIKLAVFSFVGIIISAAILTVLPNLSSQSRNMNMNSGFSTTAMGNMSMSNMSGMSNYSAQGSMNSNADLYSIQQQLNNIQQQIYQLQNQTNNSSMNSMQSNSGSSMNNSTNNNSSNGGNMNNGSSSSMSSMPMM
jgi:hypothetical protein